MEIYKIKLLFIIVFLLYNHINAQIIFIQSNNPKDEEEKTEMKKNDRIKKKISQFGTVLNRTKYNTTKIQIVFFDPLSIGGLKLKTPNILTVNNYINAWKDKHFDTDKILILFFKKNGKYLFEKLAVSYNLEDQQIFPEISSYIQNEIMKKKNNEIDIIYFGINALKNAFDRYFKNRLA